MKNRALYREIQALVSIAAKAILSSMEKRLAAEHLGITSLQFAILQNIFHQGPLTITEISRVRLLDPSTLVPAADALERAGLARRVKDPKDRRRTPLEITQAGRDLLTRIPVLMEEDALARSLTNIGEEDQQQLQRLLRALVGQLIGETELQHIIVSIEAEGTNNSEQGNS